jgi:hypothetical protein
MLIFMTELIKSGREADGTLPVDLLSDSEDRKRLRTLFTVV